MPTDLLVSKDFGPWYQDSGLSFKIRDSMVHSSILLKSEGGREVNFTRCFVHMSAEVSYIARYVGMVGAGNNLLSLENL